jgi:hypothetical protein
LMGFREFRRVRGSACLVAPRDSHALKVKVIFRILIAIPVFIPRK